MTTDIPIKYVNATRNTDFEAVVFTKNYSTNTPNTYYCAWQVLRGQTSVQFVYPVTTAVGAVYSQGGQTITAGPFPAELGSTWQITQESSIDTAVLAQSTIIIDIYVLAKIVYIHIIVSTCSKRHSC